MRLPSREEIHQLPSWGRVAFAARCARRALYLTDGPEVGIEVPAAIGEAIRVAEAFAANGEGKQSDAFDAAAAAQHSLRNWPDVVQAAPLIASHAAYAASYTSAGVTEEAVSAVHRASADLLVAAEYCFRHNQAGRSQQIFELSTSSDWALLRSEATRAAWDDSSAVPADFLGPLWPFGKPAGWPERDADSNGPRTLRLTLDLPADVDEEALTAAVAEIAAEADGLHRAYGGNGLTIENLLIEQPAPVTAGGPS